LARPALIPTMFCSAIPTFTVWSGNSATNPSSLEEPVESLTITITFGSCRARSARVAA